MASGTQRKARSHRCTLEDAEQADACVVHQHVERAGGLHRLANAPRVGDIECEHAQVFGPGQHALTRCPHRGDDLPAPLEEVVGGFEAESEKGDFVLIPSAFNFTASSLDPPKGKRDTAHVVLPDGEVRHGDPGGPPDVRMLVGLVEPLSLLVGDHPIATQVPMLRQGVAQTRGRRDDPRLATLGNVTEPSSETARWTLMHRLVRDRVQPNGTERARGSAYCRRRSTAGAMTRSPGHHRLRLPQRARPHGDQGSARPRGARVRRTGSARGVRRTQVACALLCAVGRFPDPGCPPTSGRFTFGPGSCW